MTTPFRVVVVVVVVVTPRGVSPVTGAGVGADGHCSSPENDGHHSVSVQHFWELTGFSGVGLPARP